MCGLFGFLASTHDSTFDPETIQRAALAAGQRGPESFGIYARFPDLQTRIARHELPISQNIPLIEEFNGASLVIGHARLATSGLNRNGAVQPIVVGETGAQVVLAHNGNVYDDQAVASIYDLKPQTHCDSEVLALLIAKFLPSSRAVQHAFQQIQPSPLAALIFAGERFFAARRTLPLYQLTRPEGKYFCSVSHGADWEELHNEKLSTFDVPHPEPSIWPFPSSATEPSPLHALQETNAPKESGWQQLPLPTDQS